VEHIPNSIGATALIGTSTTLPNYTSFTDVTRGQKLKKVLAIQEDEADVVRRMFDLALGRSGMSVGIKAIVNQLNGSAVSYRGKPFHIAAVHRILTSTTYMGLHHFNRRDSRSGQAKAPDQWITVPVPPIIAPDEFDQVQEILRSRSPKRAVPRMVGNPTLLTGIAKCGTCGSGMTLRPGKSGRYRYYACAGCAQKGKTKCAGRSIAMEALDGMILEHLADRLFTPERLEIILQAFIERSAQADIDRREQLQRARRAATEAQGKISRLLELVERGLMEVSDPDLKDRLEAAKAARKAAEDRVRLLGAAAPTAKTAITSVALGKLARNLRDTLQNGDLAVRKAYLRLFVSQVIVGDTEIRWRGPTETLARAALSDPISSAQLVPSFMHEWRPLRTPCRYFSLSHADAVSTEVSRLNLISWRIADHVMSRWCAQSVGDSVGWLRGRSPCSRRLHHEAQRQNSGREDPQGTEAARPDLPRLGRWRSVA